MNVILFLAKFKHPVIKLQVFISFLCTLPITVNFTAPNVLQSSIEIFINNSYNGRHPDSTLTTSNLKLIYGFVNSSPILVCFLFAPASRYLNDHLGRRLVLFGLFSLITIICAILQFTAVEVNSYEMFLCARCLLGVQFSFFLNTIFVYSSEISPPQLRGHGAGVRKCVDLATIAVIFALALPPVLGGAETWHYVFLLSLPSALTALISLPWLSESPKHLYLRRNDTEGAKLVIRKYYQPKENDIDEILEHYRKESQLTAGKTGIRAILRSRPLRKATFLAILLMSYQLTSGRFLLDVYSVSIMTNDIGLAESTAEYAAIGVAILQALAALVSAVLIERLGRRRLFFASAQSSNCLILAFIVLGLARRYSSSVPSEVGYVSLVLINLPLVAYTLGCEVICPLYVTEIVPHHARATATVTATTIFMAARLVYNQIFPLANSVLNEWTLLILCFVPSQCIIIYMYFFMIETAGKHTDEVQGNRDRSQPTLETSTVHPQPQALELY